MILKLGSSGGKIKISDAPKIAYSGKWLQWHLEFYGDELYWEAWFLSSGALTVDSGYSYTGDVWGIGGGAGAEWNSDGGRAVSTGAGKTNMCTGIVITGSTAITIGAGGSSHHYNALEAGGDTSFGDVMVCAGATDSIVNDNCKRYRFEDPDKAGEAGQTRASSNASNNYRAQGGWLPIARRLIPGESYYDDGNGAQGDGLGGGGSYFGYACHGALVLRIPA